MLNWHIGSRVNQEILNDGRAEYGNNILINLTEQLRVRYGRGYDKTSLTRMIKLAKQYPAQGLVCT